MANRMKLEIGGFDELLNQLEELGGDVKKTVEEQLTFAAETVADDTVDAMDDSNLPAQGKFSKGETIKTIVRHPSVEWVGDTAVCGVGFDMNQGGAGLLLITGTPDMKPNYKLQEIYARKKYMKKLNSKIQEGIMDVIAEKMGEK